MSSAPSIRASWLLLLAATAGLLSAPSAQTSQAGETLFSQPTPPPTPILGISATASSSFAGRGPENAINGFGFDGTDFTGPFSVGLAAGTAIDPETGYTIPTHSNVATGDMWHTASGTSGTITFDLGDVFSLDQVWVYNMNEVNNSDRSAMDVDISLSEDNVTFTQFGSTFTFDQANESTTLGSGGFADDGLERIDFGGALARYVEFDLLNNHGDSGFVGLSHVIFFEAEPPEIPEPSTLLLGGVLCTFAAAYSLVRRRRHRRLASL